MIQSYNIHPFQYLCPAETPTTVTMAILVATTCVFQSALVTTSAPSTKNASKEIAFSPADSTTIVSWVTSVCTTCVRLVVARTRTATRTKLASRTNASILAKPLLAGQTLNAQYLINEPPVRVQQASCRIQLQKWLV